MTTPHKASMGCALRKCLPAPCLPAPLRPIPPIPHTPCPKSNNHIIIAQQQINNAYNIIMQMDAKYNRQINKFTKNFHPTQSKATQTLNKHRIIQLTQARHNLHKYLQTLNILQIQIHHVQIHMTGAGFRKLVFITLWLSWYLTLPPHCIIVHLNYGVDILSQMYLSIPQ